MLEISSISAIVAAIGVVIGVAFTVLELRNLVETRQTDLVWRLYSDLNRKEFQEAWTKMINLEFKDYKDFVQRYGQPFSGKPVPAAVLTVTNFFEGVGVLLNRKLVDIGIVTDLLPAEMTWEKAKPIVEGIREQYNDPRFYEWFEYLYNEMQKRKTQTEKTK